MKYTMYKYDVKTDMWYVFAQLEDKEELLMFLSYGTNTYNGAKRARWTNRYFDEQNLTCKDILVKSHWERARDENGELKYDAYGFPVYEHNVYRNLREWHLEDEEGRTVDARIFKEAVYDIVEGMPFYKRTHLYMLKYKRKKSREPMGMASHHNYHWRASTKSHRFGRTLKTVEGSAEDCEGMLTSHQMQCLKVKPKDNYARFCWGDDFLTKGSTGWKDRKNIKQWEERQKRTESVWVENVDKYDVHIDPEQYEESLSA